MKQTSFYLMAALSLLLTGLLAGCGSSAPPPLSTLSGEWVDLAARAQVCGESYDVGVHTLLSLQDDEETVFGDIVLSFDYDYYAASFTGRVTPSGKLTGSAEFYDYWGELKVDLAFKQSGISGTITDIDAAECEEGRVQDVPIRVNLRRESGEPGEPNAPQTPVEDDALEPNNSQDEAAEIDLDYQADLVLQDDDWFKFTLSEEQLVTLEVRAKDTNFFYIDAEIYNEMTDLVSNFDFHDASDSKPKGAQLSAGTYYLNLSGEVASEARAYTLNLSSEALPDAALEPNNTAQNATPLTLGADAQAMYLSEDDEDWFSFSLDETQIVTFELQSETYNVNSMLFNAEVEHSDYSQSGEASTTTLEAGTYYLQVYRGYGSAAYSVRISGEALPDSELEPNDTAETASALPTDFSGEMYLISDDEDWFSFTLTEERIVTFDLGTSYYDLDYMLYSASDKANLEVVQDRSYQGKAFSVALKAGTHYLKVHGYSSYHSNGMRYPLKLSSTPIPDADYEPNDSFNAPTQIQLPFAADLYMSKADEDWFTFTLTETQLVTLKRSDSSNYSLRGALYADDSTMFGGGTFSFESDETPSFVLSPDTYALSLSAEGYYSSVDFAYSLSLTSEEIPDSDYEPNDTEDDAHAISLGFSDGDLLVSHDDADWFSFSLDSTTQVSIDLSGPGRTYDYPGLFLHYPNGETRRIYYDSDAPLLAAGTYALEVKTGYAHYAKKYGLSITKK